MPRRPNTTGPKPLPAPKPASLSQQQTDFTAEGAPPPGQVAISPPRLPADPGSTSDAAPPAGADADAPTHALKPVTL